MARYIEFVIMILIDRLGTEMYWEFNDEICWYARQFRPLVMRGQERFQGDQAASAWDLIWLM